MKTESSPSVYEKEKKKKTMVYSDNGILLSNRKEWTTDKYNMNESENF